MTLRDLSDAEGLAELAIPREDAWAAGVRARHAGIPLSDCPYTGTLSRKLLWERGWLDDGDLPDDA